jgi:S1-C subfamily serine protease
MRETAALLLLSLFVALRLPAQSPGASEARRTETVQRSIPAVCAVMPPGGGGGGSGVIFDPHGFALTNFHCVQKGRERPQPGQKREENAPKDQDPAHKVMRIGLPDGEIYDATVLGIDPGSDLAVLLLQKKRDDQVFPFRPLGDSDLLVPGEAVFAAGNPFMLATDFQPTVTWGVVSGTHRYQGGGLNRFLVYPDCIQVDAPVNPGNSGGPLFNGRGEIVGINGRISVRDRGRVNTGVGFAIASNQIRSFLGELMAGRHAEHGTLDMNAWFMKARNEDRHGVFVQGMLSESIVGGLGLKLGDEVLALDGAQVTSANQLATLVGVLPAESWVELKFRPMEEKGFGPPRGVTFQLPRLDTGSSRDPDRVAPEETRRLACRALTEKVGAGETPRESASFTLLGPDGAVFHRARRDGKALVVEGLPGAESPERTARLERELRCNPWLWQGEDRKRLVGEAMLDGGCHVLGRPAFRFRLPGEGECEVFLFEDGTAAGFRMRDPVRKQKLEVAGFGGRARIVLDGKLVGVGTLQVEPQAPVRPVKERETQGDVEKVVARLLPSLVKVHGASGLSTIVPYSSGVIVSEEGLVLTLDLIHLQKDKTKVVLHDGTVCEAELLPAQGLVEKLGLRLLKFDPAGKKLQALKPAGGEVPGNGTFVVSLGNCYRLAEFNEKVSVTFGVLSSRVRTGLRYLMADVDYDGELLLTDASNNPGHYGGGLFTLDGAWIGMNTRIVESTETNTQLSAAIPLVGISLEALRAVESVAAEATGGGFTGIVLFDRGGRRSPPAYVEKVEPGSPAARLGLRADDLIVRLAEQSVRTCAEFRRALEKHRPGQKVELTWKRGNEVMRGELELEAAR